MEKDKIHMDRFQLYHERYMKLWNLINSAVKDRYVLQLLALWEQHIAEGKTENTFFEASLVSHIAETTMQHFGLALCKLFFDGNSENRLDAFNSFVQTEFRDYYVPRVSFAPLDQYKKVGADLRLLRKRYYAHLGIEDALVSISVDELGKALHELIVIFNQLYLPEVDSEVIPYSLEQEWLAGFRTSYELALILRSQKTGE